ncbi:MAG TPA: S9 family peptidase [Gemmatimonadaceae bacterium]|nr:S9 family peptidase [Gemmatimonadaceae bacterium]
MRRTAIFLAALAPLVLRAQADTAIHRFTGRDVFDLEWAADPQIAPDGRRIAFVRAGFDIMKDDERGRLWVIDADGGNLRPLLDQSRDASSPRWSPDGTRLLFVSTAEGKSQIFVRWMDSGQEATLTALPQAPRGIAWSRDGKWIAFTMFVPEEPKPMIAMPDKPAGAQWAAAPKYIDQVVYRNDGAGYARRGRRHLFVIPAEGGAARQVTFGPYDDGAPEWSADGSALLFSANRHPNADYDPNDSEIYEVRLADGAVRALTARHGPDEEPVVSPDGARIAYAGYDDRYQGYQVTHLYVMNRDGSGSRMISGSYDRDVGGLAWARDGKGIYFQSDDQGDTRIGYITLDGKITMVANALGGLDLGRPYGGGSFTVAGDGRIAFNTVGPDHPADVALAALGKPAQRLTRLNRNLLDYRTLGSVEEVWFPSSYDKQKVQGWLVKPPGFDPKKKYPLVLEIHGGPFANYGPRFASEIQLYAAAGNLVLYTNPRGSTSYGETFGNLIHHDYPDHDYDDLMSGVDAVIARGIVDTTNLFVTGGSGGGVLTAWIVGHTHRFRAAVVQKPVINWYSFVLTADVDVFFTRYWFPAFPWDSAAQYMRRSPISYVGNVTTPTMLVTGEVDYRTPSSEAEQFYMALKLRQVPSAMVRFPEASHEISARPSYLVAKVAYILAWFDKYRAGAPAPAGP